MASFVLRNHSLLRTLRRVNRSTVENIFRSNQPMNLSNAGNLRTLSTGKHFKPAFKLDTYRRNLSSEIPTSKKKELSIEELIALIEARDIKLIDVREPKEIEETGYIKGALNIPLTKLKEALQMTPESFSEHYKRSQPQKHDSNIVFYGLGSVKSTAALEIAHRSGFKKARHFPGGWEEWSTEVNAKN
ncbi:DgyrCDS5410 [Dimorphilus gyrociliatus]|uniref:Sulfurtransferase n=1 Tax=Dimorphilus gyrociliatus TaxID=2664684 RepID=A0A7I8VLG4_9ANNE|nr:DgyrCDS5410 [Dimorphilus gyrociliatus]